MSEELPDIHPMRPDNPLINATEEEIKAFVRKRREEFAKKYAGKDHWAIFWDQSAEREKKILESLPK